MVPRPRSCLLLTAKLRLRSLLRVPLAQQFYPSLPTLEHFHYLSTVTSHCFCHYYNLHIPCWLLHPRYDCHHSSPTSAVTVSPRSPSLLLCLFQHRTTHHLPASAASRVSPPVVLAGDSPVHESTCVACRSRQRSACLVATPRSCRRRRRRLLREPAADASS